MKRTYSKDKQYRFSVRFSLMEYETLSRLAYEAGLPIAEVIRSAVRDKEAMETGLQ